MRKNKNGVLLWIVGVAGSLCASVIWITCFLLQIAIGEDRSRREGRVVVDWRHERAIPVLLCGEKYVAKNEKAHQKWRAFLDC